MRYLITGLALVLLASLVLWLFGGDTVWLWAAGLIDFCAVLVYGLGILLVECATGIHAAVTRWQQQAITVERLAKHASFPRTGEEIEQPEDSPIGMRDVWPW